MHFFDKARARWISFFGGSTNPHLATPAEFTEDFAVVFREAQPGSKLQIVSDLELKYGDNSNGIFLYNAYARYRMDPAAGASIIADMVAAHLESLARPDLENVNRSRIVPVIKNRLWVEDILKVMKERGKEDFPAPFYEDYNRELSLLYAEDSEHGVRYLHKEMLTKSGIGLDELKELAIANLDRLLPEIQCHGGDGCYMLTADGTYESSLILFNNRLWNTREIQHKVQGEIVVAIPTRDVLLFTGTETTGGLEKMRSAIERVLADDAPYRLTRKLFIHRDGRFQDFE